MEATTPDSSDDEFSLSSDIDSDDEFDLEDKELEDKELNRKLALYLALQVPSTDYEKKKRGPRMKSDRKASSWEFVLSWTDEVFYKQFRMHKEEFEDLANRCKTKYPGKKSGRENYELAVKRGNASTGGNHTPLEIKLAIFLRMCAGASYLDMIWYGVSLKSVHSIFQQMLLLVDKALPDKEIFNFPETGEELNRTANEWSELMALSKCHDMFTGTFLAGDGLVIPIICPTEEELLRAGLSHFHFRNRKGCFAIIVCAFCDAYGMIRWMAVDWPGSTPDIVAYKQTELYKMFTSGKIPNGFHMVLDEAYSSIGGDQHLCPYSKTQLKKARAENKTKYEQMKTFNNLLSSQRITIERCFGMLVRKWGILWKPLEFSLETNMLIVKVCCKLNNFCIMAWKKKGKKAYQIAAMEAKFEQAMDSDAGLFLGWTSSSASNDDIPNDGEVLEMMANNLTSPDHPTSRVDSQRRIDIRQKIIDCGYAWHANQENDFTLNA
jgi:hypothetical protein